jgi:acyl carrier protein
MDQILSQLQTIFRDVLDQPDLRLELDSNAKTIDGWDSLAHISLISAIEQEFAIHFALGELETLKNVGEMITLIGTKLARR